MFSSDHFVRRKKENSEKMICLCQRKICPEVLNDLFFFLLILMMKNSKKLYITSFFLIKMPNYSYLLTFLIRKICFLGSLLWFINFWLLGEGQCLGINMWFSPVNSAEIVSFSLFFYERWSNKFVQHWCANCKPSLINENHIPVLCCVCIDLAAFFVSAYIWNAVKWYCINKQVYCVVYTWVNDVI